MTVAAHGGDIYQNQITYDFSVNTNPLPLPDEEARTFGTNIPCLRAVCIVCCAAMTMCCCGNGLQHFMVFQQKK